MSFEHPYPDHAYLEVDSETNEKRWFGTKGMGVGYVHEDRVAEDVAAAIAAEREACAILAEMYQDIARDSEFDTGVLHARAGIAKVIRSRRNPA
jgi:hypothetical protein